MKYLKRPSFYLLIVVGLSTLSSCAIFKKDCGCPSVSSGKRK